MENVAGVQLPQFESLTEGNDSAFFFFFFFFCIDVDRFQIQCVFFSSL